jgi:hypothetical protein
MADTIAHLVDRMPPEVPVRQWVLSLPSKLRFDGRAHELDYFAPLSDCRAFTDRTCAGVAERGWQIVG